MKCYEQMKGYVSQSQEKVMAVGGVVTGLLGIIAGQPELIGLSILLGQEGMNLQLALNSDGYYGGNK